MKNLLYAFFVLALGLTACGGGGGNADAIKNIAGEWKLTEFTGKDGEVKTTECDKKTVWNFTQEKAEPLGDGTEVMKVKATAPDDCKWYGFDSKWTIKDGQLFISSTKVGGMGGNSNAGLFKIVEQSPNSLVLEIMGNKYKFSK